MNTKAILLLLSLITFSFLKAQVIYPTCIYKYEKYSPFSRIAYLVIQYENYSLCERYIYFKGPYELTDIDTIKEYNQIDSRRIKLKTIDGIIVLRSKDIFDKKIRSMRINGYYQIWHMKMQKELNIKGNQMEHEYFTSLHKIYKYYMSENANGNCYERIFQMQYNYENIKREIAKQMKINLNRNEKNN